MQPIELLTNFIYEVNGEEVSAFLSSNLEIIGIIMAFAMGMDLLTFAATKLFQLLRS